MAAHLRLAVARTARRLRQEAFEAEGRGELSPSLSAALVTVDLHGPLTPSELAERERVKRPTATRIVAKLEQLGLVSRTADPSDGRASLVATTAEGRALLRRLRTRKNAYLAKRLRDARPRRGRDAGARRRDPRAPARRGARCRMSAALRRSFGSLQIPNYRRYFAGQLVSLSGNWMQMVAEMWLILELTGSGVAVGVTSALQFLPILLFGAWGGVLADRWPKRELLVVTQTAMARPALALWGLTAAGAVEPWMVFALVFARGAVNSVDNPTRQSFVIEMVGADRVVNAVGLNSVLIHAARIVGPAGAGVLILTVGVAPCFLLNAATFAAMIVALRGDGPGAARPAAPADRDDAAGCARRCDTCAASRRC